jgi:beta-galactosidase/beta-glucuronidase
LEQKTNWFLNANELNFSPQKGQKTTSDAESKSRFASREVWRVGKHKGGYMSFEFDLSGQWKSAQLSASLTVEGNCGDSSSPKTVSSE